jgi:hypothetical protein
MEGKMTSGIIAALRAEWLEAEDAFLRAVKARAWAEIRAAYERTTETWNLYFNARMGAHILGRRIGND